MTDRESNMGVRVGDTIIHCNQEFTIMDIRREENMNGMLLVIHAVDPHMADKEQQKSIMADQTGQQIMELVRKLADKGLGGISDIGR